VVAGRMLVAVVGGGIVLRMVVGVVLFVWLLVGLFSFCVGSAAWFVYCGVVDGPFCMFAMLVELGNFIVV
jgi:hypothetical protein